ncbi:hypothetical protein [Allosphingosinicella deserti]|uniref:Uncharacterized protein n=1 Tax=Allosphingosinicella deserti TaxID=2116704 RepID=A0A2P7QZD0_9SPHN|nr:hypothetical protein [Sphingomonas deserti]PSJ43320.1 hypothetical protein C7I55_02805 [Sphingomonas deserti]
MDQEIARWKMMDQHGEVVTVLEIREFENTACCLSAAWIEGMRRLQTEAGHLVTEIEEDWYAIIATGQELRPIECALENVERRVPSRRSGVGDGR